MKVLTFTLAMLILLAVVTYARLQKGVDRMHLTSAMQNHMAAHRELENAYQTDLYWLKVITRAKPKPTGMGAPKRENGGRLRRGTLKLHLFPYKFNLRLATLEPYKTFAIQLLTELHPEYAEEIPEIIERLDFEKELVAMDMGDLRPVWIEMLRGDLLDHVTLLDNDNDKRLYIANAPLPTLTVLFGDAAEAIAKKSSDLQTIYRENPQQFRTQEAREWFTEELKDFVTNFDVDPTLKLLFSYALTYKPHMITVQGKTDRFIVKRHRNTQPILLISR